MYILEEHLEHIKKLLKYVKLGKLLKHTDEDNFPPAMLFAVLEEYRRRVISGKYTRKASHFPAILRIGGILYGQGDENNRRKIADFFTDLNLHWNDKPKQENKTNWDVVFKQCEKDSEREYWKWLDENPDWLNEELKRELERERKQAAKL